MRGSYRTPSYHPQDDQDQFVCYANQYVPDGRTLTLSEPWAWLIEQGYKDVENRSQHFRFMGRMFIHAAKVISPAYDSIKAMVKSHNDIEVPTREWLERNRCGRIVAVAEVAAMLAHIDSPWKMKAHWAWPIKWCHSVNATDVIRGYQGFWRIEPTMRISCLPL
jgi:hypothetical protein